MTTGTAPTGLRPELAAAAGYLGFQETELRARLLAGATLGGLADERGRPLATLVQTMVDIGRARLAGAVAAGQIPATQLEPLVADLHRRVESAVGSWTPFPHVPAGAALPEAA